MRLTTLDLVCGVSIAVSLLATACTHTPSEDVDEWVTVDTGLGVTVDVPVEWEIDGGSSPHSWRAGIHNEASIRVFVGNNTTTQLTSATRLRFLEEQNAWAGREVVRATFTSVSGYQAVWSEHLEGSRAGGVLSHDVNDEFPGLAMEWHVFPTDVRKIEIAVFSETHSRSVGMHIGESIVIADCIPWLEPGC